MNWLPGDFEGKEAWELESLASVFRSKVFSKVRNTQAIEVIGLEF